MTRLEIQLLGGFEAKLTDRPVQRFESQKARALLGYLALHRDQPVHRDHLAGLLWPERPNEVARRNLRQALYSIRTALGDDGRRFSVFERQQDLVRLHPDLECWVDVDEFRSRVREGLTGGPDPRHLTEAARLYKGDLLAGFFLRDCVEFEEWLITHQEQFREEALQTFRVLIDTYLARGEHRFGIQYAKRLLAIDPLSEETHRQLMRLYLLAGRRNRALAQYEQLLNLLQAELGVDPVEKTTELYRSALLEGSADIKTEIEEETSPPIIPLVGRSGHLERLQEIWASVLEGNARFTVVTGESGAGKSRLVKSFVDGATSRRNTAVLRGRAYAAAPLIPFGVIGEAVRAVFSDLLADEPDALVKLPNEVLADLALLCPELASVAANASDIEIDHELAAFDRLPASFMTLLDIVLQPTQGELRPVILLLEDLQWADAATLDLLGFLAEHLAGRPIWLLATGRDLGTLTTHLGRADTFERVTVERLDATEVREIAKALVDLSSASGLADFLWQSSQGLPLAIAELVNLLWDERGLVQLSPGRWALRADPRTLDIPEEIVELIQRRFSRLPNSSRRLMSLAAILGHQFDVEVLTRAGDEHLNVVETAIEVSLERWLIRQFPRSWSQSGPERDIVLWARGARRGFFEFSHRAIRASILERINPLRKRLMHGEAARALAEHHAGEPEAVTEELAFHFLAAGEPAAALPWLELAAERAQRAGARAIAERYRKEVEAARASTDDGPGGKSKKVVALRRDRPSQT